MFRLKTTVLAAVAVGLLVTASRAAALPSPVYPGQRWTEKTPAEMGLDASQLASARDYALSGGGSGMITRGGYVVLKWGDQRQQYDLKSSTKSLGATLLGVALLDD